MNTQNHLDNIQSELGHEVDTATLAGQFTYAGHTFTAYETFTEANEIGREVVLFETAEPVEIEGGVYPEHFAMLEAYEQIGNAHFLPSITQIINRLQAEGIFGVAK